MEDGVYTVRLFLLTLDTLWGGRGWVVGQL